MARIMLAEVLSAESTHFSRSSTAVIITAAINPLWINGIQQLLYRGIQMVVIYIDPESFDSVPGTAGVLDRLAGLRVPVYRVRLGESLEVALREPEIAAVRR